MKNLYLSFWYREWEREWKSHEFNIHVYDTQKSHYMTHFHHFAIRLQLISYFSLFMNVERHFWLNNFRVYVCFSILFIYLFSVRYHVVAFDTYFFFQLRFLECVLAIDSFENCCGLPYIHAFYFVALQSINIPMLLHW